MNFFMDNPNTRSFKCQRKTDSKSVETVHFSITETNENIVAYVEVRRIQTNAKIFLWFILNLDHYLPSTGIQQNLSFQREQPVTTNPSFFPIVFFSFQTLEQFIRPWWLVTDSMLHWQRFPNDRRIVPMTNSVVTDPLDKRLLFLSFSKNSPLRRILDFIHTPFRMVHTDEEGGREGLRVKVFSLIECDTDQQRDRFVFTQRWAE